MDCFSFTVPSIDFITTFKNSCMLVTLYILYFVILWRHVELLRTQSFHPSTLPLRLAGLWSQDIMAALYVYLCWRRDFSTSVSSLSCRMKIVCRTPGSQVMVVQEMLFCSIFFLLNWVSEPVMLTAYLFIFLGCNNRFGLYVICPLLIIIEQDIVI